jgi:hypothetical protein
MERLSADDQGGDRTEVGRLGLSDVRVGLAQVRDLDVEACGIDTVGELLLGGATDWAPGVEFRYYSFSCKDS